LYRHGEYRARFLFSSGRRHASCYRDRSSDVCSSALSVQEGSPTFTLFVFGSNFVPGATVQWRRNGTTNLQTTFDSSSKLQAIVRSEERRVGKECIHGGTTNTFVQNVNGGKKTSRTLR